MIASFVFDLDSTVLKGELLPAIGAWAGDWTLGPETMASVMGSCPFAQSFPARVKRLQGVPVARAAEIALRLPRYEALCGFLRANRDRCYLATGNLDVWIEPLVCQLGLSGHCFSSVARVEDGHVVEIVSLLDKSAVLPGLPRPIAAVGDGMNDVPMLEQADVGIAFAASHPVPEELAGAARYVARDEASLLAYLESLSAGFQLCGMERTACDPDSREEGYRRENPLVDPAGVRFLGLPDR